MYIYMAITAIALLVNENAIDDLKVFVYTLQLWTPVVNMPTLYIYCTTESKAQIEALEYSGQRQYNACLDAYSNLSRRQLEQMSSEQGLSNRWHDFMNEKCSLMEWALAIVPKDSGMLLCDADLCWLGPLPLIPSGIRIALSPHEIRLSDEAKYGKYNGGLVWINDVDVVHSWRKASRISSFFEQLALNDVAEEFPMHAFGTHVNYGWWRMFQGHRTSDDCKKEWTIRRSDNQVHSGLLVKGLPVVCIHTHWKTTDHVTNTFNTWIVGKLTLLKGQPKVGRLLRLLLR